MKQVLVALMMCALISLARAQWKQQSSGTTARLRSVSAVDSRIAWASGTGGTYVRTTDGGNSWQTRVVPGAESLDFRDVEGFSASIAYLLSIGSGESSRIYKTADGGQHWSMQFINRDPKAFFDAMAFWDSRNGIAVSDPVDGKFVLIRTSDAGTTWNRVASERIPPSIAGEAAFAASGTCIATQGARNVWFATGGGAARVFRSADNGQSWAVSNTPVFTDGNSSGIFSIAFSDSMHGVIVGGDYKKEGEARENVARTTDGGRTWTLANGMRGYRSAVAYVPGTAGSLVAVGPSGSDRSNDHSASWTMLGAEGFHALDFAQTGRAGWAVGENGRLARFVAQ